MSSFVLQLLQKFDEHRGPKFYVSYENCRKHPDIHLTELLKFLDGGAFDRSHAALAVAKSSFEAMQDLEIEISRAGRVAEFQRIGVANWTGDVNALKVRRGLVGGYRVDAPWLDDLDLPLTGELIRRLRALG